MNKPKLKDQDIFLDTPVKQLYETGVIDKIVLRSCLSAKPPMLTAGDIIDHLRERGSFSDVPGCRRPGRIPVVLSEIVHRTTNSNTPIGRRSSQIKRQQASDLIENAGFNFMNDEQRARAVEFRQEHGHLPMFSIIELYLNRPAATRNDVIMAYSLGLSRNRSRSTESESPRSLSEIGNEVHLSRERVRQIALTYTLPDLLNHPMLWRPYADHSVYYVNQNDPVYQRTATHDVPGLSFAAYASILHRTTMLQNMDDKYMARRGWTKEIAAWEKRLSRLAAMPRTIESRLSVSGLAQGGKLDTRIRLVVLNQIAPALGLEGTPPDFIILPKNRD